MINDIGNFNNRYWDLSCMLESSNKRDIERTIELIRKIGGKKVRFITLYGSMTVRKYTNLSDIDIAVFYEGDKDERFKFRMKILGRVKDDFDVRTFQDLPVYIRKEIISHGKMIYFREYDRIFDIFMHTIREFEDFKPRLDMYYSSLEA